MYLVAWCAVAETNEDLFLGTWAGEGSAEEDCVLDDFTVTLRVYESEASGSYNAHFAQVSDARFKSTPECQGLAELYIVESGPMGGDVILTVREETAVLSSSDRSFNTITCRLSGQTLTGSSKTGTVRLTKRFPEFRYAHRERGVAWDAIRKVLSAPEQVAFDATHDYVVFQNLKANIMERFKIAVTALIEDRAAEDIEAELENLDIDMRAQFDGMTAREIIEANQEAVIVYLEKRIQDKQAELDQCRECTNDELKQIQDTMDQLGASRAVFDMLESSSR